MTQPPQIPNGRRPAVRFDPRDVVRLPDGPLWTYDVSANVPTHHVLRESLHFLKHVFHVAGRLKGALRLHEASAAEKQQIVREAVVATLEERQAITWEGALTCLVQRGNEPVNPPSTDILCNGPKVRDYWAKDTVTVVVRRGEISSPGLPEGVGPINAVVTAVPRRRVWLRIIAGMPMPSDHETYLIKEGEIFNPDHHCVWANREHPMFDSPDPSEPHHASRDR